MEVRTGTEIILLHPEGKGISAVRHLVGVQKTCVRSMMTGDDIFSGQVASARSPWETKMVRNGLLKTTRNYVASVEDQSEVGEEGREESGQEFLKSIHYRLNHLFGKVYGVAQSTSSELLLAI